jgi:uncharacterized protein YqjF (DUF2071 family)
MRCLDLDRVTPTKPPAGMSPSGYQTWKNLLFVHFTYPAEVVRALVPAELELDLWDDQAYVGLVPFEMVDIRLGWSPKAFAFDFLETNLRTYVHYKGEPGVYFFSLEAASLLAVKGARWGWGLPYHHAEMEVRHDSSSGETSYSTVRRSDPSAMLRTRYTPGEALGPSEPGSLEFFLLERYYLFSVRGGRVDKGHVHHVPYPAQRVEVAEFSEGLIAAAGLPQTKGLPPVAHFSKGVEVEVFGPWPVAKP